ncbi:MAG: YlxM family DNA-binding protein [Hespellia sp.]|nr:YlxM family DNA-binding protein [Hespellia sp.]
MNEILEEALLYDFYGELLTEHQKSIYEQYVLEDYSLSEIAAEEGISRQGVHDLVKRCQKILTGYEEKLHLVDKFLAIRKNVHQIEELLQGYEGKNADEILSITQKILEEL